MECLTPTFDGKRAIPSEQVTRLMISMLDLTPADRVLEIGTGSAYQTQAFANTGCELHTIELEPWIDPTKVEGEYVFLHSGDGRLGIPSAAPFTAIVATCGVNQIPKTWIDQLADGGRMVVPIGDAACQRLTKFRKHDADLIPERIAAYTRFQMLREKPPVVPIKPQYKSNA